MDRCLGRLRRRNTDVSRTDSYLNNASLEDLMNIKVTSVEKKVQKVSHAGAAVYEIAQEDIRRSGMHGIPDLLRMVPGVDVTQNT
jgi:iron complex outermembrane receptor protein